MPVQKASGTDNLRANPTVKSSTPNSPPSGAGKDAGGTSNLRSDHKVISSSRLKDDTPRQQSIDIPPGVQHFDDDMGRN